MERSLREWQRALAEVRLHDPTPAGQVSWIVGEPFRLSPDLVRDLVAMGEDIRRFLGSCSRLLREAPVRKRVEEALSPAERESVRRFGGATRFPMLVRPDLVVDRDGRPHIAEIDLQPAHAGVLQRMQEIAGEPRPIATVWAETFPGKTVISVPRWKPFCSEHAYFAGRVRAAGGDLTFLPVEEWNRLGDFDGVLFKNCCTLDLLRADYPEVVPPRAVLCPELLLDWKGWLALAHEVGALSRMSILRWIPESYLLPLHPKHHAQRRRSMIDLTREARAQWVIKPLGSWGGRGFAEAGHLNREQWNGAILGIGREAAAGLLLQRKVDSRRHECAGMTPAGEVVRLSGLRMRLGPYYVMTPERSRLAGVMVTLRRSIKVHTATDAVHVMGMLTEEATRS